VASGVSLGDGRVVTFAPSPTATRFRVTLPGGGQSDAALVVADELSGLALLEIDRADVPGLALAEEAPAVGSVVFSAAGAGIEEPVVSLGIVGGVDRSLRASGLPPLVQCDLRTTETSSGAAVIDRDGALVGIIAATPEPQAGSNWTYAVGARHVRRVLAARVEGSLVVLRRERPTVGLTLGAGAAEGTVRVDRVVAGGPADEAGIAPGDLVLEADGRKVRSAYQAVSLVLRKQPGETLRLVIERSGEERTVEITLGGGAELAAGPQEDAGERVHIGPRLGARTGRASQIEVQDGPRVAELAIDGDGTPAAADAPRIPRDEVALLSAQIDAFAQVIERLQAELVRRDEAQRHTNELIQSLTEELGRLRDELATRDRADP
jgi:S1-C subfamily serine protease